MIVSLGYLFWGMSNSKATGIAAVAGGFAEGYVLMGMAATVTCEVGGMVLLFRAFSRGHRTRSALSVLSIFVSGLTLLFFSLSIWLFWFVRHHVF
jgi:hypothetical protein